MKNYTKCLISLTTLRAKRARFTFKVKIAKIYNFGAKIQTFEKLVMTIIVPCFTILIYHTLLYLTRPYVPFCTLLYLCVLLCTSVYLIVLFFILFRTFLELIFVYLMSLFVPYFTFVYLVSLLCALFYFCVLYCNF